MSEYRRADGRRSDHGKRQSCPPKRTHHVEVSGIPGAQRPG
jgi:hypothetical protein